MVDVIDGAAEDDGGDAADAGLLGLADAGGGLAEVDDFHFEAGGVEGGGEGLLGLDADGAAGVVEGGVLFHGMMELVPWLVRFAFERQVAVT